MKVVAEVKELEELSGGGKNESPGLNACTDECRNLRLPENAGVAREVGDEPQAQ